MPSFLGGKIRITHWSPIAPIYQLTFGLPPRIQKYNVAQFMVKYSPQNPNPYPQPIPTPPFQVLGVTQPPVRIDSQAKYGAMARGDAAIYLRFPHAGYREKIWDHAAGSIVITGEWKEDVLRGKVRM